MAALVANCDKTVNASANNKYSNPGERVDLARALATASRAAPIGPKSFTFCELYCMAIYRASIDPNLIETFRDMTSIATGTKVPSMNVVLLVAAATGLRKTD